MRPRPRAAGVSEPTANPPRECQKHTASISPYMAAVLADLRREHRNFITTAASAVFALVSVTCAIVSVAVALLQGAGLTTLITPGESGIMI